MLRARLQAACDHLTPDETAAAVADIGLEIPHTVVALPSAEDPASYTCLVHALAFTGTPEYIQVALLPGHDVFAGADFAGWLLANGHLRPLDDVMVGALVLYLAADDTFRHIGLLRNGGRVESKWGTLGLFEHGLWEVPASYGDKVGFYEAIPFQVAIELFYDYAEENGVTFYS